MQFKGLSRVFSITSIEKHQFFGAQLFYGPTLTSTHDCWKNHSFDYTHLCQLSKFVIVFLPRSNCLLISWLQSPSAVILEPKKIKFLTVSIVSPSICQEVLGPDAMIFILQMMSFKPAFSLSSFTFIKRLFSSSLLSAVKGGVICISEVIDTSPGNLHCSLCFIQPNILHDVLCI